MLSLKQALRLPAALRTTLAVIHGPQVRSLSAESKYFTISEEVRQALSEHKPVVALESTIYTHGFPYPDNVALASRLESFVRVNGGVPATIGILDGQAKVGLGADELVRLASASKNSPDALMKCSRRDLGFALAFRNIHNQRFSGGTTVSATMLLAHRAGIKVFATGGLGGVHRGADQTMDVSADLTELGRTPVAVISSGCKAFLDIPKTLEYLETQGVGVATFADGRAQNEVQFPAFWSRDSGFGSPAVVRDAVAAAEVIHAHFHGLGLQSGLLLANPIPFEHEIPFAEMQDAIDQALAAAHQDGATGAASTPYILAKIKELTGSRSMIANKALVENNVVMGAKVARELVKLEQADQSVSYASIVATSKRSHGADIRPEPTSSVMTGPASSNHTSQGVSKGLSQHSQQTIIEPSATASLASPLVDGTAEVFVAGALNMDFACDYLPRAPSSSSQPPELHTSNPARIAQSLGGVGHNIARAAHLMGADVRLCAAVGDDLSGKAALEALALEGLSDAAVKALGDGRRTSQYLAVNDSNKDLVIAMADMSILDSSASAENDLITETFDSFWLPQLQASKPSHLVVDGNWPPRPLARWLQAGRDINAHITFEPVSNAKAARLFHLPTTDPRTKTKDTFSVFPKPSVHLATPNAYELRAMHTAAKDRGFLERQDWWEVIDAIGIPSTGARTQLALATNSDLVDQGIPQQSIQLLPFIPCICTKLGAQGVLVTQLLPAGDSRLTSGEYAPHILSRCSNGTEDTLGVGGIYMRLFPAVEQVEQKDVVSVNGVGDTFAGTLVAGLAKRGLGARVEDLIDLAQRAAVLSLKSHEAVSPGLGTLRILL